MVQVGTCLFVADNSGALYVQCIRILGTHSKCAQIGDFLVVAVKKAIPNKKIKTHEVCLSVLIRQKKHIIRKNGMHISCLQNAVVLIDKRYNPIGTRIKGFITQELRKKKLIKLITMSSCII